jgi:hypothetical protein
MTDRPTCQVCRPMIRTVTVLFYPLKKVRLDIYIYIYIFDLISCRKMRCAINLNRRVREFLKGKPNTRAGRSGLPGISGRVFRFFYISGFKHLNPNSYP